LLFIYISIASMAFFEIYYFFIELPILKML